MILDKTKTNPGLHKQFRIERFTERERRIIERLSRQWYMTSSGAHLRLAASEYDYFLMKPTPMFSEMFNIERELIVVLSPYPNFEPRSLDVFDVAQRELSELRVETVCRVLISDDENTESKVAGLLKTDPEQPIVIPFTYRELDSSYDDYFVRNRFRTHFYSRDLFAFLSPLKKDLYFFGRSHLLQEIVNKHRAGEHTGLFGLRKSGKTSIIYAVERHLQAYDGSFVSIDCESPSVHILRWNELLERLAREYQKTRAPKLKLEGGERYSEKRAADSFAEDLLKVYRSKKAAPVLILFDEIERISPGTASSPHWRSGADFVLFWQTLRGFYQRNQDVLTYMLVGTNPSCVEAPMIAGHENPLFGSIPSSYVPSFSVEQTREMVRKLGRFMGLHFEELLYSKLVEDFGGHPFLIRHFCSKVHDCCKESDRPIVVDRALYAKAMRTFQSTAIDYLAMIVGVLREWYPDEYDMLRFLAQGDNVSFASFASDQTSLIRHLVGYGLISQGPHGFSFNIEALRVYLNDVHKYERVNLTEDEKVAEISSRRIQIEKQLRVVARKALRASHGKQKALEAVLSALPEQRRERLSTADLEHLLHRDESPLYFLELINLVKREWSTFQNVFEVDKQKVELMLTEINSSGRPDAHAKYVGPDEFAQLRLYFKKLERALEEWA